MRGAGKVGLLYVEPGFERLGLGALLLAELERRACAWGLTELSLESSHNACEFYLRYGYQTAGAPTRPFGVLLAYPFKKPLSLEA